MKITKLMLLTLFCLIGCMLINDSVFAAGEVEEIYFRHQCKAKNKSPVGFVVTNRDELLKAFRDLVVPSDWDKVDEIISKNHIDFEKQVVIYVIGEESVMGYDIALKDESTRFRDGVLKLYFEITLPNVDDEQKRVMEKKHPIYFFKTVKAKIDIDLLEKVEFYRKATPTSQRFSVWPE